MANVTSVQVLEEGPRNVVVKMTGVLDTSDLAATLFADVSTFTCGGTRPAPTQVRIDRLWFAVQDPLAVSVLWDATTDVLAHSCSDSQDFSFRKFGGLQNNAGAGKTGDVMISTSGWTAGVKTFTVIAWCVKQGPAL